MQEMGWVKHKGLLKWWGLGTERTSGGGELTPKKPIPSAQAWFRWGGQKFIVDGVLGTHEVRRMGSLKRWVVWYVRTSDTGVLVCKMENHAARPWFWFGVRNQRCRAYCMLATRSIRCCWGGAHLQW